MTIIAALAHEGKVYMGADSLGINPSTYGATTRKDPKIYRVGPMLIGFTSSFRMGQLLGYQLVIPEHNPDAATEKYMATRFVDAVRECLKCGGYAKCDSGREETGEFLVAYRGRIFHSDVDFHIGESVDSYNAVGCGARLALGSLHTSAQVGSLTPAQRVCAALQAAERFSAGVRGPFLIEELEEDEA